MLHRRPDLIVPIRDRRQHKRILTLKNFGIFVVVALIAFVAISTRSELRGNGDRGDYGGLLSRELPKPVEPKPMEVVHEAQPVVEQTHADPMLVEPMTRAQWLQDQTATVVPVTTANASTIARGDGDVTIVGDSSGVTIIRRERHKPVLSGGFGK